MAKGGWITRSFGFAIVMTACLTPVHSATLPCGWVPGNMLANCGFESGNTSAWSSVAP